MTDNEKREMILKELITFSHEILLDDYNDCLRLEYEDKALIYAEEIFQKLTK